MTKRKKTANTKTPVPPVPKAPVAAAPKPPAPPAPPKPRTHKVTRLVVTAEQRETLEELRRCVVKVGPTGLTLSQILDCVLQDWRGSLRRERPGAIGHRLTALARHLSPPV